MLTAKKLKAMLQELISLKDVGCTYDFKERFSVGLETLEVLDFVKVIRSRIPKCDDHCVRYNDCDWIPFFEERKSVAKFKLTKAGLALADMLESNLDENSLLQLLQKEISSTQITDLILSQFLEDQELSIVQLISIIKEQSNLQLNIIRSTIRDVLDLLESLKLLKIEQGTLFSVV
ncbi:MAG TPA: hypothetical protein VMX55_11780 [candidate division Zixibacteria bacterium]|nr:hypothetical protein [candidate division Zixibacteria bacterium]